jgi:murein DD-endopeptidase MepM/ murein hydrolase activator NlpD
MPLLRTLAGCGPALVGLLCLAGTLLSLRGCGDQIHARFGPGVLDPDPAPGTCDNVGLAYPDNPFSGWPVVASWADVSATYCDPHYLAHFGRVHWGIDLAVPTGTPVLATAHATVVRAAEDTSTGMGKHLKLCTPTGWCAIYMHLDGWQVVVGEAVTPGQVLGWSDNTGFSTGPHLHYQLHTPLGQPVDPAPTLGA